MSKEQNAALDEIRAEFPLFDDADLDQEKHHCEWSVQHDRKRLNALLDKLQARAQLAAPAGVVLPVVLPESIGLKECGKYGAAMARGFNACLREVRRLNAAAPSPAPASEHSEGVRHMVPTIQQLAEALSGVQCFHDLSAELIAPTLRANLVAAIGEPASDVVQVPRELSDAARDVLAERHRQVCAEGWTPEHDDSHEEGHMATAGGLYAQYAFCSRELMVLEPPMPWPWHDSWWKPTDPRRNLIKAGALILAEIERIDRALLNGGRV